MESSLNLIFKIWKNLNRKRKKQLIALLILIILGALFDLITIGSILPFLTVLTNPERLLEYKIFTQVGDILGFSKGKDFIIPISFLFAFSAILASSFRILIFGLI